MAAEAACCFGFQPACQIVKKLYMLREPVVCGVIVLLICCVWCGGVYVTFDPTKLQLCWPVVRTTGWLDMLSQLAFRV
jgi:hypothetical protein